MKDKQAGSTRGNVDDELAQALADTEGHDPPADTGAVRATPARTKAKGSIGLASAGVQATLKLKFARPG